MIETPKFIHTEAQPTAIIPVVLTRERMPLEVGAILRELLAAVAAQGLAPTGPWFAHHLRPPTETFDLEVGVPVASPVTAAGRMRPSEWPEAIMIHTIYRGPYEGLNEAWDTFTDWLAARRHNPLPDMWESYLKGPDDEADPAKWRTQLYRPFTPTMKDPDVLSFVRRNKEMFRCTTSRIPGLGLAQWVVVDALVYGKRSCEVFQINDWWFVASPADWLAQADGADEIELFTRLIATPEIGDNGSRSEILLNAFADAVWILTPSSRRQVKGSEVQALEIESLLSQRPPSEGWQRIIAFLARS